MIISWVEIWNYIKWKLLPIKLPGYLPFSEEKIGP
jgi:hypothetical protein